MVLQKSPKLMRTDYWLYSGKQTLISHHLFERLLLTGYNQINFADLLVFYWI